MASKIVSKTDQPAAPSSASNSEDPISSGENRAMRFEDVTARLAVLADEHESAGQFYQAAIKEFALFFSSPYVALVVNGGTGSVHAECGGEGANGGFWKNLLQGFMDETLTNLASSRYKLLQARQESVRAAMIAAPLWGEGGNRIGCVVCVTEVKGKEQARFRLSQIERMAIFLALFRRQQDEVEAASPKEDGKPDADMLARVSNFESQTELAYSITNGLRARTDCDMVGLAVCKKMSLKVLSISGSDDVNRKSPGVKAMIAAFEESLDMKVPIVWPQSRDWLDQDVPRNHRLHRQWSEAANGSHVASIPLFYEEQCVGVIGLRRPSGEPFSPDQIASLKQACGTYGPAFELVDRATRGLFRHAMAGFFGFIVGLFDIKLWLKNTMKFAVLGLILWIALGSITYEIPAPTILKHAERQSLASPYSARVVEILVDSGDSVAKGQILCRFETQEHDLELKRIRSEVEVAEIDVRRNLALGNAADAALVKARLRSLKATEAITVAKIEKATVRAPQDGVVLESQLRDRVGDSIQMGEVLFEIGEPSRWLLELRIDERDIGLLAEDPVGEFSCRAKPEVKQGLAIFRIHPLAEQDDGRNVFLAEAKINQMPSWAKSGMEGLATIEVGRRRVWWIASRRAIDWLKLNFWL